MCLRPRTIRCNSLVKHIGGFDTLTVNCGKCSECEDAKRSAILIRAFYEHKDSKYTFFDTLTYNDEYLPDLCGYKLFRRKDVQNFLKRLRISIQRHLSARGIVCKSPLSFLVTSEYGGLRGRPHYHILFHVKTDGLSVLDLKELINKTWRCGFTDSVNVTQKHVVNNIAALQYVVKYVCKDSVTKTRERLAFRQYVLENNLDCKKVSDAKVLHDVKLKYSAFWQSSLHYGERLLSDIDYSDLCLHRTKWIDNNNLPHYVALPRYYVNKVFRKSVPFGDVSKISLHTSLSVETCLDSLLYRIQHTSVLYSSKLPLLGLSVDLSEVLAVYSHVYRGRIIERIPENPFDFDVWTKFAKDSLLTSVSVASFSSDFLAGFPDLEKIVVELEKLQHVHDEQKEITFEQKDAVIQRLKCLTL